jgi:hypothetical protein
VQAGAAAQHLNLGELILGRAAEPLRKPWREGESTAVGQFNDHALAHAVIACRGGARLMQAGRFASSAASISASVSSFMELSPTRQQ